MKQKLTQAIVKQLFNYDRKTGILTLKKQRRGTKEAGSIPGWVDKNGYIGMNVLGGKYSAHRIIWLYLYGYMPKNLNIDHIDRNPSNNKISNLRLVSQMCNCRNCSVSVNNTSGVRGISWNKRNNKWEASIHINYKKKSIGLYNNFSNAVCARLAGEQCLNWSGCDSYSPAYKYVQEMLLNG